MTNSSVSEMTVGIIATVVELKKVLILMEKAANEKDFRTCASLTK